MIVNIYLLYLSYVCWNTPTTTKFNTFNHFQWMIVTFPCLIYPLSTWNALVMPTLQSFTPFLDFHSYYHCFFWKHQAGVERSVMLFTLTMGKWQWYIVSQYEEQMERFIGRQLEQHHWMMHDLMIPWLLQKRPHSARPAQGLALVCIFTTKTRLRREVAQHPLHKFCVGSRLIWFKRLWLIHLSVYQGFQSVSGVEVSFILEFSLSSEPLFL